MKKDFVIAGPLAALAGFGICIWISQTTGRQEAWDASLYYTSGIPMMSLVIFLLSFFFPKQSWRWTLFMVLGQSLSGLVPGSDWSLWPLALIFMTLFSLPQFGAGVLVSWLVSKFKKP